MKQIQDEMETKMKEMEEEARKPAKLHIVEESKEMKQPVLKKEISQEEIHDLEIKKL
jgi:hypothetical protein